MQQWQQPEWGHQMYNSPTFHPASQARETNNENAPVNPQQLTVGYSDDCYNTPMYPRPPNSTIEWASQQNGAFAERHFVHQGLPTVPGPNLVGNDGWPMNNSDVPPWSRISPIPATGSALNHLTSKLPQIEGAEGPALRYMAAVDRRAHTVSRP